MARRKVRGAKKSHHKPLKLLKHFHARMKTNVVRLENLIKRREAGGN